MILTIGLSFALGVLFPVLMDSFNENRERTAWVSSVAMAMFLFLGPLISAFVNRFGCRLATIVGCLTCAVGLALGSVAPNITVLYFVFSAPFGIGTSFIYISSPVTVTQYFSKRRSVALGIVTAGQGLGTMIFGPTLQALVDAFDWRNTMLIMAGVLAMASLTGCLLKGNSKDLPSTNSQKFSWNFSVWKSPKFIALLVVAFCANFSRMIPYVHLIKHCNDLGIPADKSATLFLFLGLFASTGRLMAGFLCDIRWINSQFLYQASVFILGAAILLLIPAKTYASLAAVVVLFSVADGLMVSTFIIELFKSVMESQRASSLGFCMLIGCVSVFCGPPVSGLIADKFGNYMPAFLIAGGVGVLASFIPFVLQCIKKENSSDNNRMEYLEELMDMEQNEVTKKEAKSDDLSKTTVLVEMVPTNPVVVRTSNKLITPRRPISFMWAMESPFHPSPS